MPSELTFIRSVIVLSSGEDSEVIKTLPAIVHGPHRRTEPYHIVAVMRDQTNLEVARMVGQDEVELLWEDDVISRIIAQTCRQSGLSVVYEEILGYAGDGLGSRGRDRVPGRRGPGRRLHRGLNMSKTH